MKGSAKEETRLQGKRRGKRGEKETDLQEETEKGTTATRRSGAKQCEETSPPRLTQLVRFEL
eukprot:m.151757 g.151757  ORF g.151757 m.151757 type:complete len:62 (-) comp16203_c0_seq5:21-206(-)